MSFFQLTPLAHDLPYSYRKEYFKRVFKRVLFLFVALGCYLGELLDSPALGFLIVGGFYLLFTLIVWGMKHGIRIGIMNMVIEALQANDDEDDKGQSQNPSRPGYPGEAGDPTAVSGNGGENFR